MQVAVLCATRTAYFIYLLEPARLVTVSIFKKISTKTILTLIAYMSKVLLFLLLFAFDTSTTR
jgi:hypothetical protein